MLNSTNNIDTGKWQEFVLDEVQSDHEKLVFKRNFYSSNLIIFCLNLSCSDNELPLSSIGTTNNIYTEKWQDIMLNNIQSNMEKYI